MSATQYKREALIDCDHSWKFLDDDPYIFCATCGELRDAQTGRIVWNWQGEIVRVRR